ncbi:protein RTF1 homolog [Cynara cardunculus var. scolymus]|uniref:Plus-3 n=1 Tax=Cynara cardunculus var. scolymus TaxID=59895 RepID=A0A118K4U8_CYNCS|nr:protein RTF1 homolog [Cynara cardunculus var. scolymus]KVI08103.1 Plus-3 [Cynara cardunculus var. scolymus]
MADLDEMLLEAAGRTGRNQHSPPPSRRRRKGSYSDDGSDSRDDDSDDDHGYASRKPSGSQVPLKKRLDPAERDDEHSSSREDDEDDDDTYDREGDSDDDSVGSDLYKGEEDRQRLAKMSELDREMILAERATKKNDKDLKNSIKKQKEKSTQSRKDSPPPHTVNRAVRSSARSTDRATAIDVALNELRARKRLRQQDPESHRKRRDADTGVKRKGFTPAALSTSSHSDSGSHSEDEESTGGMGESDDEKVSRESTILMYEDVKGITIRRSKLAKWFMEPFFEELIVGCFVRVGIGKSKSGPIYRLCIVRNVDAADPDRQYKLENKMTHKYLNVVWGNENSAARWQMAMISDSPPLKEEFDQLIREVERHGGRMPSKQEVLEKREAIEKTNSFVYSAETVKQMLQEKKSTIRRPLNVAAEKDRLRREMEVAQMKHDETEVEKIKAKLHELEASRQTQQKDKKAIRLAEMNRKNRVENFKNASEMKPVSVGLKAGEAGYDPFSRRWTRSRNYYVSKPGEAAAEANGGDAQTAAIVGPDGSKAGIVATVAALEAAADAGKLVDTSAPVDKGTESNIVHDFDLPISLASLQKFGGPHGVQAGFMARKQRIEATVGCQVPENDGRRHALTLSVSDYKRRRGLL